MKLSWRCNKFPSKWAVLIFDFLTCWVRGVALKSHVSDGGPRKWWHAACWPRRVLGPSEPEEWREARLPVQRLQPGGEDGGGGRLAVPAVHVRLDGVDAGRACSLAAVVVTDTVSLLPLVPRAAGLLQRLAEQGLVVAVGVLVLPTARLHLLQSGWHRPGPRVSVAVVSGHVIGGVPAGEEWGRYLACPGPLRHGGVVVRLALLVVRVVGGQWGLQCNTLVSHGERRADTLTGEDFWHCSLRGWSSSPLICSISAVRRKALSRSCSTWTSPWYMKLRRRRRSTSRTSLSITIGCWHGLLCKIFSLLKNKKKKEKNAALILASLGLYYYCET